ncbi:MAG: hypothetical protein HEP71_20945 [Roseivirga sp.]|nr:hypothetical protein [Roseivirga sp.]
MRKVIPAFFILAYIGIGEIHAQDLTQPKSGNAIRLKEYTVTIAQGEELNLEMWVVAAKKYKLKLGQPEASGKSGVLFTFGTKDKTPISYDMKLKVDSSTPAGDYMYILKVPGTGRNTVKSTTLMVKVVQAGPQ